MSLDLSKRQRIAMRRPCFEAEDTVHQRYFEMNQFAPMSSLLTLNVGME
jgi:hypothetical protein